METDKLVGFISLLLAHVPIKTIEHCLQDSRVASMEAHMPSNAQLYDYCVHTADALRQK